MSWGLSCAEKVHVSFTDRSKYKQSLIDLFHEGSDKPCSFDRTILASA